MLRRIKISTGCQALDRILGGGIEGGTITELYGPAASGKTNISISCAINSLKKGKRVIYIDTEGGLSVERMKQIGGDVNLEGIMVFEPTSFMEQEKAVEDAVRISNKKPGDIGLIVLDSAVALYRAIALTSGERKEYNRSLGKQLSQILGVARRNNLAAIVTSQVYSHSEDELKPVGEATISYWSKVVLELEVLGKGIRRAILRKHRYLPEGLEAKFRITQRGIEDV